MANLVLSFAELLAGAVILDAGIKGASIADVIQGKAVQTPLLPSSSSSSSSSTGGGGSSSSSGGTSSPSGGSGTVVGDVTYSELDSIASQHGWSSADVDAWAEVIKLESNGTISDTNSSSGAYGIAQFIDGAGEYAEYGGNSTSVVGELTAMANYIEQRYGNPSAALTFHLANGWY